MALYRPGTEEADLKKVIMSLQALATAVDALQLIIPASGQVVFPATQNASTDANTLDDYEEGLWTPVLTFATPGDLSVTYGAQRGWYEKIGRVVIVHGVIVTSAFTFSTASGNALITGLPFTANSPAGNDSARNGGVQWQGITKANYTDMVISAENMSTNAALRMSGSGQVFANVTAADMPSGGTVQLRFGITYSA